MQFRLLGPLEVEDDGEPLRIAGAKQRALLGALLLSANRPVSRERLIEELWGESAPPSAAHRLEEHVSRLRRLLHHNGDQLLHTEAGGYRLRLSEDATDLAQFEQLVRQAKDAPSAEAAILLRRALALWRGKPLQDVAQVLDPEVRRLDELRVSAHEQLIEVELAQGRHAEILGDLEELVRQEAFRERLRALLMLALYRAGRQADALAAYQEARATFVNELGIEPGRDLKDLEQAMLRQDPALDLFRERALPPLSATPVGNLPRPATSLVGREREIEEVVALLASGSRLVTLTGAGGSGKTRLALEASYRAAADFPDGVFWVALAALADAGLVMSCIAQSVGASGSAAEHIAGRRVLLVVDNFEHVIEAGPDLSSLVRDCPRVHLLVTSRELLRLGEETEYGVLPLADSEATELFCTRGRIQRDETVAELCRQLDNLPLAIELAAARTTILSPRQILGRIGERLDVLEGPRTAERRQRTLRATLEWSHELLSAEERRLFSRLAVFAGGWTIEAAVEVVDADLDTLESLVEKSLVQFEGERAWMLETTREFATERLEVAGAPDRVRRRHAVYFAELAELAAPELPKPHSRRWYAALSAELANLRAALSFAYESGDGALLLRLAGALAPGFWQESNHLNEALVWLERALAMSEDPLPAQASALRGATVIACWARDGAAWRSYAEAAVAFGRAHRDSKSTCLGLANLALLARDEELDLRRQLLDEAIAVAREAKDDESIALVLLNEGGLALDQGAYEEALLLSEEAAKTAGAAEHANYQTLALLNVASAARELGDLDTAVDRLRSALRISSGRSGVQTLAELSGLATIDLARGHNERAARLAGAVEQLYDSGFAMGPYERDVQLQTLAGLRVALGETASATAMAQGRTLSLDEAVAYALGEPGA
jgi:predicted ATPase/DNA-binding SARP family transcriptional activator